MSEHTELSKADQKRLAEHLVIIQNAVNQIERLIPEQRYRGSESQQIFSLTTDLLWRYSPPGQR